MSIEKTLQSAINACAQDAQAISDSDALKRALERDQAMLDRIDNLDKSRARDALEDLYCAQALDNMIKTMRANMSERES